MKTASSNKTTNDIVQKWLPVVAILYLLIWKPGAAGPYFSPLIFLAATVYLLYGFVHSKPFVHQPKPLLHVANGLPVTLFVMCLGWSVFIQYTILRYNPIDIAKSDIIPLIRDVYYSRFIHGEFVYGHVQGYDYISWTPNYLPFHWLPFIPAFSLGFDPRWIAFAMLQGALSIHVIRILKSGIRIASKCLHVMLPYFILWILYKKQSPPLAHHVEMLIAGYYLLLSIGIASGNKLLKVAGFTFTLLSRYIAAFFLPYALFTDLKSSKRSALWVYGSVLVMILLFYVLPFLTKDPGLFFSGASAYDVAALGEWKGQSWQQPTDRPYQLFQGYGLACWFWKFFSSQLTTGITVLKFTLLMVMLVLVFGAWLINKKETFHPIRFTLALLLLQLAVFPTFSLVPYNYLFWSFLFSLPVVLFEWESSSEE